MRLSRIVLLIVALSVAGGGYAGATPASDPIAKANKNLTLTARSLVAEKGEARTFTYGPIVDDANNRSVFRVPGAVADLTGVDFVPLATIQQLGGDVALFAAVSDFPNGLPGKSEALKMLARRQLIYFQRPYFESYFRDASRQDPKAFSALVTAEVWEAFKAEYGDLSSTDPGVLADRYPDAAETAEITGLDIVPLAGIRARGGMSGLNELLIILPDSLQGKDEAIEELSKAKNK